MITPMTNQPPVPRVWPADRTFKFSPEDINTGCADTPEAQAALRRVGQLRLQVDSLIHESEANAQHYLAGPQYGESRYWNPSAPVQLWGDALSVSGECAPAGTKDVHIFYRTSRQDGEVGRVDATTVSDGHLRAQYYHPLTGGSMANQLGNMFYSAGLNWLGSLCQEFDHGPKNERIEHWEQGQHEEVALLADGSAQYTSSTS